MPTRCNRGFYCRSYCLLNMFRASLCPSSGAQVYYTVVAACGISCCDFSSSWSGVELRVMRPVCRLLNVKEINPSFYATIYILQFYSDGTGTVYSPTICYSPARVISPLHHTLTHSLTTLRFCRLIVMGSIIK